MSKHGMTPVPLWTCLPHLCEAHCDMRTVLAGCKIPTGGVAKVARPSHCHQGLLCLPALALISCLGAKPHQSSPSQTQLLPVLLQASGALGK